MAWVLWKCTSWIHQYNKSLQQFKSINSKSNANRWEKMEGPVLLNYDKIHWQKQGKRNKGLCIWVPWQHWKIVAIFLFLLIGWYWPLEACLHIKLNLFFSTEDMLLSPLGYVRETSSTTSILISQSWKGQLMHGFAQITLSVGETVRKLTSVRSFLGI